MKTVIVNREKVEVPDHVVALIPGPGVRIEGAEGHFKITPQSTLKYVQELQADKWAHIGGGQLFQHWFKQVFGGLELLPATLEDLQSAAMDVQHITGLIILLFEALHERKERVFLELPETYLHPKQVYHLMSLIQSIRSFGAR